MARVFEILKATGDPLCIAAANVITGGQEYKRSLGKKGSAGREPGQIKKHGLNRAGVINYVSGLIRKETDGFFRVPLACTWENLVVHFPSDFDDDVVAKAHQRIAENNAMLPTADPSELDARADLLLARGTVPKPSGTVSPTKLEFLTSQFLRSPAVKAFVLQRANGTCEACDKPAPFLTDRKQPFLELHHLKALAAGGSDTVGNAVAVCPNCHRALHCAADREQRLETLFRRWPALTRE